MKKSPLLVIFLVVFLDLVGFGIVIPILPYYSLEFGANAWALGWLMAVYSLGQFLFAPLWGSLSDRFGRRPILLITILCSTLAMAGTAMANSLLTLFIARSLAGLFGANISTASAYIADVTAPEDRAKGMGIIGASFGLGFLFGPAIGGTLAPYGYHVPILTAAALGLINLIFAFFVLHEPKITEATRQQNRRKFSFAIMFENMRNPKVALPILLFFLCTLGMTQLEVSFGLFVLAKFGLGARDAGFLLAGMGVVAVVVQGGLIGRLAKRFGEFRLVTSGLFVAGIALLFSANASTPLLFAATLSILAIGTGLINPSLSSAVSKAAPDHKKGEVLGVYQSAGSLARIIGPPVSGFIFDQYGIKSPIYMASVLMICAMLIGLKRGGFTYERVHE